MGKEFVRAIAEMEVNEALRLAKLEVDNGQALASILADCQEAMNIVGERYEKGDYFLPELIMAGETLNKISNIVMPKLQDKNITNGGGTKGQIVLGTVRGDIHYIGKDIVKFLLDVNGFKVTDLGVDVPEDKFVAAVHELKPQVVGLSGLLTIAYDSMKSTVEALHKAGLRDKVKIMIGGAMMNESVKDYAGADAFGTDAMAAVRLAREWTTSK